MNDAELADLVERQHRIKKLTETEDWKLLVDYCASQINSQQAYLMNGYAKTVEEYRGKAGWVQGAQFVLSAPERLAEQIQRERDEIHARKAAA